MIHNNNSDKNGLEWPDQQNAVTLLAAITEMSRIFICQGNHLSTTQDASLSFLLELIILLVVFGRHLVGRRFEGCHFYHLNDLCATGIISESSKASWVGNKDVVALLSQRLARISFSSDVYTVFSATDNLASLLQYLELSLILRM